ncbi:hypothetical protein Mal48_40040 [Thalassoglobus polymorphus]|uniref:Uncharacterized protein n=1 Tax=Thalassoglobus polymorphus TaxID=2527994 RepID=A0A517QSX9_9PLAN|nr:hypothetical protein Mal48_40040 [Thalassoglobus polymorphus]
MLKWAKWKSNKTLANFAFRQKSLILCYALFVSQGKYHISF